MDFSDEVEYPRSCTRRGCKGHFVQEEGKDYESCDECGLIYIPSQSSSSGFGFRIRENQKKDHAF
jgi:hypothetical protein